MTDEELRALEAEVRAVVDKQEVQALRDGITPPSGKDGEAIERGLQAWRETRVRSVMTFIAFELAR